MVKTQKNHRRGIGVRSLSVILALLLVLSTCVVMLTVSMFSVSATISYWYVSGNFNGWTQEATSVNKINGSSGSVTIPLTASSIKFKMIASEGGDKWCGNSDGTLTLNTKKELSWNSGTDINCALPANTVAVTFTITVENGKNYITVSATTSGGDGGGGSSAGKYTTTVNTNNPNNGNNIFWVNATYYDYLSDTELTNGWLYPSHVGTSNFNGATDDWYPFYKFNREVVKSVADSNTSWSTPLYFGNFCNTYKAYDTGHHPGVTNGYTDATNSYNVTRFNYAANNSNGVYDRNTSVQGLMGDTLQYAQLQTPDGTLAPYFNESALGNKATIVKSSFPFRTTDYGTYKRYEFDSTNAKDNVFFTWATENGVTYPQYVNYGAGTSYGVKDGIKDFMNETSGYGIFPFNNASTNYKGTKTYANNNLDYGFGIRMDMKFRVPKDQEVKFDFSGDDDLWMYITDETTKVSQLVLDMGGDHKESTGEVNFTTKKATVNKVDNRNASNRDIWIHDTSNWGNVALYAWDNSNNGEWYTADSSANLYRFRDNLIGSKGNALSTKTKFLFAKNTSFANQTSDLTISDYAGRNTYTDNISYKDSADVVGGHCESVTKSFDFNPDHTYTMTIFYMERGLIESNCKMGFTITPLGNNFIVTERINTTNINPGLQQKVQQLSQFGFKSYNNNTQVADSGYGDFTLSNGGKIEIPSSVLGINSYVKILQYAPKNTYLTYRSSWDYYDNEAGYNLLDSGTGFTSNGVTTVTSNQTLINASNDPYDYAELQVDYEDTPISTDVSITKVATDSSTKEFPATVQIAMDYDNQNNPIYATYDLEVTDNKTSGSYTAAGGRISLQNGKTITIHGVPEGARVKVVEDADEEYNVSYSASPAIVGTNNSITVTNTPKDVTPATATIEGTKTLDGRNYSGGLFKFVLEGLEVLDGDTATPATKDTYGTNEFTVVSTNGKFSFSELTFTEEGTYRYHVYEDMEYLKEQGVAYYEDIYCTSPEYLVTITVTKVGTELKASDPEIIQFDPYEAMIADPSAYIEPERKEITIAEFNKTPVSDILFENEVMKGSVTINKTNQASEQVKDVTFAIYKVDELFLEEIDEMTDAQKYDAVKALPELDTQSTDEYGQASFSELDIYEPGYTRSTNPTYQCYALIEIGGNDSYHINITPQFFTFPTYDDTDEAYKYDYTFDYVNGKIVTPLTAGQGMAAFRIIGMIISGVALVTLAGFVLYKKRKSLSFSKAKHYINK